MVTLASSGRTCLSVDLFFIENIYFNLDFYFSEFLSVFRHKHNFFKNILKNPVENENGWFKMQHSSSNESVSVYLVLCCSSSYFSAQIKHLVLDSSSSCRCFLSAGDTFHVCASSRYITYPFLLS